MPWETAKTTGQSSRKLDACSERVRWAFVRRFRDSLDCQPHWHAPCDGISCARSQNRRSIYVSKCLSSKGRRNHPHTGWIWAFLRSPDPAGRVHEQTSRNDVTHLAPQSKGISPFAAQETECRASVWVTHLSNHELRDEAAAREG